ncbi:hypothetical protein U1Q18_009924, partial [Sarracenia purpurea var. burkii]
GSGGKESEGTPFRLDKMANLKARIHRLKGLSPLKIKDPTKELQSNVGVGV